MGMRKLKASLKKRLRSALGVEAAPAPAQPNPLDGVDPREIAEWVRQANENAFLNKEMAAIYYEDMICDAMVRRHGDKFLARHNAHVFSQSYEDFVIAEIFARIGSSQKTFIEIGTEDGNQNTTRFLLELGWRGVWIEGDPNHVRKMREKFAPEIAEGRLTVVHALVNAENISDIVASTGIGPEVDFLSVDIDHNTSHVWRSLPVRARVACVEYNAHIHPSIAYEVPYDPEALWNGSNLFGGSLKALELIGREKAMSLVGCDLMGINAYFVADEFIGDKFLTPYTAEQHYQPPRYRFARGDRGHPHALR